MIGSKFAWAAALALATVLTTATEARAVSGETITVIQRSVIRMDGETVTLNQGQLVDLGDIIATGEGGQAEVLFPDQTRIVVGPNSQLEITRLLFRNNGTARRFSVKAVRGTFRFLSGESPSRAYSIETPTATMGVRGTSFDFAVEGRDETDLVVFTGAVRMCGGGRRCAVVPGGCQAVWLNNRGNFAQPETVAERAERLASRFPYIRDQERLTPRFRTNTANCEDGGDSPQLPVRQISLPSPVSTVQEDNSNSTEPSGGGNPAE